MQQLSRRWRATGARIGFVPTMGYLHAGHLGLVSRARSAVGKGGKVVVSIFVNPTQFGPSEDFSRYPRDMKRDLRLCRSAGADAVFAPDEAEMYPGRAEGKFTTHVVEDQLSAGMEGAARPGHFRGVTTIVAKLFNCVLPDVAVFGAKDYQQAAVIGRMTRNLNFPVRLIVAKTLREPDGLAMSSRNKYLQGTIRTQARVLWRAIQMAQAAVRKNRNGVPATTLRKNVEALVSAEPAMRLDYVEFFDPKTLVPVRTVRPGTRFALAAFAGKTRLIDNAEL